MADTAFTLSRTRAVNGRMGFFVLAFIAGLAIRLFFLPYNGTVDVSTLLGYGQYASQVGLAHAYFGDYFPIEWWIFELVWKGAHDLGVSQFVAFRLVNLAADIGCFALLIAILRKWRRSPSWALLYWLHPYFLVIAWLGYVDAQELFFALVALLILSRPSTPRVWLLAGVPLGIVLLMKPQGAELVAFLVLLLVIYVLKYRALTTRVRDMLLILIAPCLVLVFASVYFAIAGDHSLTFLAGTMAGTPQVQSSLNAQMPNLWLPVAVALWKGSTSVAAVHSGFGYVSPTPGVQAVAGSITAALLIAAAFVASRTNESPAAARVLSLWAMCTAVVPITFTEAHENHFFLAAVLLSVVCAISRSRRLAVVLSSFLLLQAANLFLLYGFGDNHLSVGWVKGAIKLYTAGWASVVAILSVALFVLLSIRTVQAVRAGLSVGTTRP